MNRRDADALAAATGIGSASLLVAHGAGASFGDAPLVKGTALPYLLVVALSLVAVGLARAGAGVGSLWLLFAAPLFALGAFGQYLLTTLWAGAGVGQYLPTAVAVAAPGGAVLAGLAGGIGWHLRNRDRTGTPDRPLRVRLVGREPRTTIRYLAAGTGAATLVFVAERFAAGQGRPWPAVAVAAAFVTVAAWGTLRGRRRAGLAAAWLTAVTLAALAGGPAYELAWGAIVVLPALAVERNDGAVVPVALVGVSTFYLVAAFSTRTLGVDLGYVLRMGTVAALLATLPVGGMSYLLGRAFATRPARDARERVPDRPNSPVAQDHP